MCLAEKKRKKEQVVIFLRQGEEVEQMVVWRMSQSWQNVWSTESAVF